MSEQESDLAAKVADLQAKLSALEGQVSTLQDQVEALQAKGGDGGGGEGDRPYPVGP
jgi:hypothetical protein